MKMYSAYNKGSRQTFPKLSSIQRRGLRRIAGIHPTLSVNDFGLNQQNSVLCQAQGAQEHDMERVVSELQSSLEVLVSRKQVSVDANTKELFRRLVRIETRLVLLIEALGFEKQLPARHHDALSQPVPQTQGLSQS